MNCLGVSSLYSIVTVVGHERNLSRDVKVYWSVLLVQCQT
jgi:hypothetical protein